MSGFLKNRSKKKGESPEDIRESSQNTKIACFSYF